MKSTKRIEAGVQEAPSLRQLKYFIALAEAATFRRAAVRLGVSQPTLTNQIAALEKRIGVCLFERTHAGSPLTPAGRDLLASALRVREELQGFVDRAKSMSHGPAGTYKLGVSPTLGPYLLPFVLPAVHRRFEALKFYVREGAPRSLEDDLLAGEHDLILTPLPVSAGDLVVAPLFHEPLQLVLPAEHRLAGKAVVESGDLRGEAVLTLAEHHLFHHEVERLCERLGAHVLRDYEGTSLDTLRQMVVMGMGVTFLPALYVRSEIRQPKELCVTRVEGETMVRTHALVWRPTSPGVQTFERLAALIRTLVAERLSDQVTVVEGAAL